jgi:tetratricopeptide (TPR) repeat protein
LKEAHKNKFIVGDMNRKNSAHRTDTKLNKNNVELKNMKIITTIIFTICFLLKTDAITTFDSTIELAKQLDSSSEYKQSAIEFRRAALFATNKADIAALSMFAADEYIKANLFRQSLEQLDKAGEHSANLDNELALLYAKVNEKLKNLESAKFYLEPLTFEGGDIAKYSTLNIAALNVQNNQIRDAEIVLRNADFDTSKELMTIQNYNKAKDKKPWLGGVLGIIPGLGYAYSGEYANGLRSLILNAIFIFGMVETADEDQWGLFSVVTFFELTWYTGSIYGGIDSAHRYNQARMQECVNDILGDTDFKFETEKIPTVKVSFQF